MADLTFRIFPELDSTNTFALNEPDLAEGTVIAADSQGAGRGRLGRTWQSPPGLNLYFSLVLYPSLPKHLWGGFSLVAGAALADSLSGLGLVPNLKWPNDVLIEGRKLAGILLESKNDRLVVGMGINVNQVEFPSSLKATSIKLLTGRDWSREDLLTRFAGKAVKNLQIENHGQFAQVLSAWRAWDIVLGNKVTVLRGNDTVTGTAVDIGPGGELVVEEHGFLHILHSGEVTLQKEAE